MKTEKLKEGKKVALVAILGVTPAVLTEAVWALAHQDCPVVPDDILILTTGTGKKNLDEQIQVDRRKGVWASLKHDLAADGVSVEGKLNVRVELFLGEDNRPTEDLPTEAANLRAADKMMKELRDYTDDDDWVVYGLLAGGRKTMSALFFSCMCLLGRRDDRIYHVLVSDGYENRLEPPFCYPQRGVVHCGKITKPKVGKEGASAQIEVKLKSEDCKINLFSVPFVCMGEWCQVKCKGKRLSYSNLIAAVSNSMDAVLLPKLTIDFAHKSLLLVDGMPKKISESEMLVFVAYLQTQDEEEAKRRLYDLQFLLDPEEGGENYIDEMSAAAPWLEKLVKNQIFYRPEVDNKNGEQKRLLAHDFSQRKNSLCGKLPEIVCRHLLSGNMSLSDVEWRNFDCVKKPVLEKIFFKGIPNML